MSTTSYKILAIDEDRASWERTAKHLAERGLNVLISENLKEAYSLLKEQVIDLVLLDESQLLTDYLDVIREIKDNYTIPLFVLSRSPDSRDRITAIEVGAEAFVTKPIDANMLSARIKSLLKLIDEIKSDLHEPGKDRKVSAIRFSEWILDFDRHELRHIDDGHVDLTSGELDILKTLVLSAGKVLSREKLFNQTRGRDSDTFDRAIDVQISRIRQKLNHGEGVTIRTIRGVGYMLDAETEEIT